MRQLEELLQQCTVKLTLPGRVGWGTGFFVAPEWILTCAHVVQEAKGELVQVRWQKRELEAVVERSLPEPYDLALLRVTLPTDANPPCVYLDEEVRPRDPLYLFGYPDEGDRQGEPRTFYCDGLTGSEIPSILFNLGQVRPGMSGSPLLNQRTGKVCGMVKFTRDRSFDLGGGAVSTATILAQFPELQSKNHQFHQQDVTWSALLPKPVLPDRRDRQDYRYRQTLLNTVRNNWIKSVLENSLYSRAQIELGLEERFDVLELVYEIPETSTQPLAKGTKIIDQFDELGAGRSLLILGAPGSGKTTTLLELTRDLITRAEQDVNLPIPVVFNLSSWTNPKQKIQNWLVRELSTKYRVSRALGRTWIREEQLLLLLDGLDEVREDLRGDCIQAINRFYREFGQTEIVVCSRLKDYEDLRERFQFQEAIILQPLTQEQVSDYLNRAGEKLAGVRMAWQTDPVMQELAQTPLMLSVMALAYQGMSAEELPQTSLEERQNHLWDKYIDRMFERRKGDRRYSKEEALVWLNFLAQKMVQESQTIFLIEQIQPSWLQPWIRRWIYPLSVGLLAGLAIAWGYALTVGWAGDLLSLQMIIGLLSGIFFGSISSLRQNIQPFEALGWSWSLERVWKSAISGFLSGPIIALIIWLVGPFLGLPVRLLHNMLLMGLAAGLILALITGVLAGLVSSRIERKTTFPNQGVRQSAKRAGTSTLITLLIILSIATQNRGFLPLSAFLGCIALYTGGLACVQHLAIRLILWQNQSCPWNYNHFLNFAAEKMFLQKVGGGYQFTHDFLRKHFNRCNQNNSRSFARFKKLFAMNPILTVASLLVFISFSFLFPLSVDVWKLGTSSTPSVRALQPRLNANDCLIIDKLSPRLTTLHRGDIVSIKPTEEMRKRGFEYVEDIKQIIGLPEEQIEIKQGKVFVNKNLLVKDDLIIHPTFRNYAYKIPKSSYLVLVNNPKYEDQLSNFPGGVVPKNYVTGKVLFRFCPLDKIGGLEW